MNICFKKVIDKSYTLEEFIVVFNQGEFCNPIIILNKENIKNLQKELNDK